MLRYKGSGSGSDSSSSTPKGSNPTSSTSKGASPTSSTSTKSVSASVIAGAVIGGLVFILLVLGAIYYFVRVRRRRYRRQYDGIIHQEAKRTSRISTILDLEEIRPPPISESRLQTKAATFQAAHLQSIQESNAGPSSLYPPQSISTSTFGDHEHNPSIEDIDEEDAVKREIYLLRKLNEIREMKKNGVAPPAYDEDALSHSGFNEPPLPNPHSPQDELRRS